MESGDRAILALLREADVQVGVAEEPAEKEDVVVVSHREGTEVEAIPAFDALT